jgi:hypothetical protein
VSGPQLGGRGLGQLAASIFLNRRQHRITAAAERFLPNEQPMFVQGDKKLTGTRHTADRLDVFDEETAREDCQFGESVFSAV